MVCLTLCLATIGSLSNQDDGSNENVKKTYICIYLSGFHASCLYWVSRRSSPRSHCSPSPPMKLMTSQSLPQALLCSAFSVMIMSHCVDLAGLGHRKNSLTLHCFLRHKTLVKVTKSLLPTPLVFTQNKEATHPRISLGSQLTPSKTASFLFFLRLHWLEHGRSPCSSENLAGTF